MKKSYWEAIPLGIAESKRIWMLMIGPQLIYLLNGIFFLKLVDLIVNFGLEKTPFFVLS
jgi:hypothetical protein